MYGQAFYNLPHHQFGNVCFCKPQISSTLYFSMLHRFRHKNLKIYPNPTPKFQLKKQIWQRVRSYPVPIQMTSIHFHFYYFEFLTKLYSSEKCTDDPVNVIIQLSAHKSGSLEIFTQFILAESPDTYRNSPKRQKKQKNGLLVSVDFDL